MAIYNLSGAALASAYSRAGTSLDKAYDRSGTEVFSSQAIDYSTYPEALEYAYQRMMSEYGTDTFAFALFTDNHGDIREGRTDFFQTIGSAADWTKLFMIDMGDTTNLNTYSEVQAQTSSWLQNVVSKMDAAGIPQNRRIQMMGNHDVWAKDADNETYGMTDHSWLLSKYFKNTGATHYYDNDIVQVDSAHGVKIVGVGAWDFDTSLGGNSHYAINGSHMEKIIEMLSAVDNYDIIWLSHIVPVKNYSSRYTYNSSGDGVGAIGEPTAAGTSNVSSLADVSIDSLLSARNNHTSGTINDSYGISHSYDFTNTNGRILCSLSGHQHCDIFGYSALDGMLVYVFDCYYQTPKGCYFGLVDNNESKLKLWKIDQTPMVYEYELPLRV